MSTHIDPTGDVERWLAEPAPPISDQALSEVIRRTRHTPQRRRWWPFRTFPFAVGMARHAEATGRQTHRRPMMFSTTTVALGAVFALTGGVFLVAGTSTPSTPSEGIAGASATSSPSPEVDDIRVEGSMRFVGAGVGTDMGTTTIGDDDVERNRGGGAFDVVWESDDPRFVGDGTVTSVYNEYRGASGVPIRVGWGTQLLETQGGSWRSAVRGMGIVVDPYGGSAPEDSAIPVWLVGDGDYAGMTALLLYRTRWTQMGPIWDFEGWVVPGDAHLVDSRAMDIE